MASSVGHNLDDKEDDGDDHVDHEDDHALSASWVGHNLDNNIDRLFEQPRLVQPVYRGRLLRDVVIGEKNSLCPRATRFKLVRLVPELQFNDMLGWVRKPTS